MYIANSDASTRHMTGQTGISYILRSPRGKILYRSSKALIVYDSTIAEFEAMFELIEKSIELRVPSLKIRTDSKWIADAANGFNIHRLSNNHLDHFSRLADLIKQHQNIHIEWVPRRKNKLADKLAKTAMRTGDSVGGDTSELMKQIQKNCVKRIVKRNKFLLIRCDSCNEPKSVDQFPPKLRNGKRRNCFHCMGNLSKLHS